MIETSLKIRADNLRNREPAPEVEDLVKIQKMLMEEKLKNKSEKPLEIDKSDYDKVVKRFKSKQTKSYDFLIKAGENYQEAIFKLCKRMIKDQEFPGMFRRTLLYMIWKQKGPQEVLKNNRFIHLKEHNLPRTVEALVVDQMKEDILENSTMYQVGHCIEEHLFTMYSGFGGGSFQVINN